MFVVAAFIFTILMYIVFAFGFPIYDDTSDGKLVNLYNTVMVFSVISAILVFCQIMSGARRIEVMNAQYGKYLKIQGFLFMFSNLASSIVYYLLATQYIIFSEMSFLGGTLFQLIMFATTELLPILSFVFVTQRFIEVMEERHRPQRVPVNEELADA